MLDGRLLRTSSPCSLENLTGDGYACLAVLHKKAERYRRWAAPYCGPAHLAALMNYEDLSYSS